MAIDIEAPGADEADLKAAIQALANEIVVVTLSANTTLDSTYYSKLTEVDTTGVVVTFPTAPATQQTLDVINTSAGNITVNGLTVGAGKAVGFISLGSAWVEVTPNVNSSAQIFGAHLLYPVPVGGYAQPVVSAVIHSTAGGLANRFDAFPFWPLRTYTYDQLRAEVTVAGAAATEARLGIYSSGSDGKPDALLREGSTVIDTATTGVKTTALTPITLNAGTLYWIATLFSGAPTMRGFNSSSLMPIDGDGTATQVHNMYRGTSTYGAMPSTAPAGATRQGSSVPAITLRVG